MIYVHEDKRTRLEGDPRDPKYWHRILPSVCFIDWQKAFERVNWTKLMQILKETGID